MYVFDATYFKVKGFEKKGFICIYLGEAW